MAGPRSRSSWTRSLTAYAPAPSRPVAQAVVTGVGFGEVGEALGVRAEVEGARVDDHTADGGAVPAEELGGRVDDDVRPVLDGAQQVRGGHGVVDDERQAGGVRDVGDAPDVEDVAARVAEGLREQGLGVRSYGGPPRVEVVGVLDEGHLDAEPRQGVPEQVVRAAVEGGAGDDVIAGRGEVQEREGLRGLPRGEGDGGDTAFEGGDALFEGVLGGVVDAGVDVAGFGQGEEVGRVLGVAEDERGRLVDRDRAGAGGRVGRGAGVELLGLERPGRRADSGGLALGGVTCGDGVDGLAHGSPRR